jgi:hypothetical protein
MITASVIAAIGFGATGFMPWFLIALLREGPASLCYWIVPIHGRSWLPERDPSMAECSLCAG